MKKRYYFQYIICLLLAGMTGLLLMSGCKREETEQESLSEGQYQIYYLDSTGMELATEVYTAAADGTETEELIGELLSAMGSPKEAAEHKSAVPQLTAQIDQRLTDEVLSVYFSDEYNKLAISDEVMFRAAYVKTMTQIPGVRYVCFYVNNQPLMDAMGNVVGIMLASDFVEDIGSGTYRTWVDLSVYYGAGSGSDKLAPERITVGYGKNVSIERVIIEQLIKGPGEEGHVRTVPAALKLLSVSTRDGICYVNFDSTLTVAAVSVTPAVTIYSIVNSLCELSTVNKVQISINSSSNLMFGDTIDLSQPFERSLDMIETVQ